MLIYLILELSFCSLKKNTNTNSIHKHVQEWSYIGRDGASLRPKFRGSSRFEADPRMTVDMQQNLGSVYDSIWFSCKPDTTTVILPFHFFWTYWHLLLQKTAPPPSKEPTPQKPHIWLEPDKGSFAHVCAECCCYPLSQSDLNVSCHKLHCAFGIFSL